MFAAIACAVVIAISATIGDAALAARAPVSAVDRSPASLGTPYSSSSLRQELDDGTLAPPVGADWLNIKVRPGDTLSDLFNSYSLPAQDWRAILALGKSVEGLRRIHAGDVLHVRRAEGSRIAELRYNLDEQRTLRVLRNAKGGFTAGTLEAPLETRHAYAIGVIESSLYASAQRAGLPDNLAMELATIFGWDIDFAEDIRAGDRFAVIFEETYRHGQRIGNGSIIAAEFVNQNTTHRAFRYANGDRSNYYGENGRPMRKAFLRTPVEYSRITSGYGKRRHPIFGGWRKHTGIDYAAPQGTPVRAAGDGRIETRGWKSGYGNTVVVRHGSGVETLYGHLSRFAANVPRGAKVKQGQIIGYVGETGWATGPHLHYEFRVNGVTRNPADKNIPITEPLPKRLQADFSGRIQPYVAQLDALSAIQLARNETGSSR